MASLYPKGNFHVALGVMSSALSVIAQAIQSKDITKCIFTEKDFLIDCIDDNGVPDNDRLKESIGDVIILHDTEDAKLFSKRLNEQNIDHIQFDVIKRADDRLQKNIEKANEIRATVETWIVPSKAHNEEAKEILQSFRKNEKEKRIDPERLIKAARSPIKPFELSVVQNVDNKILHKMERDMRVARFYSVIEGSDKSTVILPTVSKDNFMRNMIATIGTHSGYEKDSVLTEERLRFEYENSHMLRAVDDRKPFFIADLKEDGSFSEGVVIDKSGARRLLFTKDKTYVVESYKRESNLFAPYAAYLIGKYENPGYVELTGSNIQRDDILKAAPEIKADKAIKEERNPVKELASAQKNYLIQNFIAPTMTLEISGVARDEALSRIRSAKWHALENGLILEAEELGKDEAEGAAATTSKNKHTVRGIDLNTVDHEGFDFKDDLCYATREELAKAIGLNETEIEYLNFLSRKDSRIDNILRSDVEVQRETVREIKEFYKEICEYKDTQYADILPTEVEQLLVMDRELEIDLEKEQEAPEKDEPEMEL